MSSTSSSSRTRQKRRQPSSSSVASRYLAAIHCPAAVPEPIVFGMSQQRQQQPYDRDKTRQTTTMKATAATAVFKEQQTSSPWKQQHRKDVYARRSSAHHHASHAATATTATTSNTTTSAEDDDDDESDSFGGETIASSSMEMEHPTTYNLNKTEQSLQSHQRQPQSRQEEEEEAPTEIMMSNLSSSRKQQGHYHNKTRRATTTVRNHYRHPRRRSVATDDTMTDVTGTSTELMTNRTTDLHRRILEQQYHGRGQQIHDDGNDKDDDDDEHDSQEAARRQPLHLSQQQQRQRQWQWQPPSSTTTTRQQRQQSSSLRKWPPPLKARTAYQRKMPIEINSLLSDTSAEMTEETSTTAGGGGAGGAVAYQRHTMAAYPTTTTATSSSMPMGRLGRHVVGKQQQQLQQQQHTEATDTTATDDGVQQWQPHSRKQLLPTPYHQRNDSKTSFESFQDQSLTSSVGVETGVQVVTKSAPALKRVFEERAQPTRVIPVKQQQTKQSERPSSPLTPPRTREETFTSVVAAVESQASQGEETALRISDFPPRPPLSSEKSSLSSNPFMVRYSAAKGASPPPTAAEQRALYDVGTAQSDTSSGGWTPVPLSSSGMISEDFVLDPDRSPMRKDAQPLQALFSADRISSAGRSSFEQFYRPESSVEGSNDSVGPPDIHRVTAEQLVMTVRRPAPRDAPGAVATDDVVSKRETPDLTPSVRTFAESRQVVSAPSAIPDNLVMESDKPQEDGKRSMKSLPHSRAWRRELLRRKQRRSLPKIDDKAQKTKASIDTADASQFAADHFVNGNSDLRLDRPTEEPAIQTSAFNSSVSRNLFPSRESGSGQDLRESTAAETSADLFDSREEYRDVHVDRKTEDSEGLRFASPTQVSIVQDRVNSFSPPRTMPQQYVPPWKAKLKQKAANENAMNESSQVPDKKMPEYVPPWKVELMKKKSSVKEEDPVESTIPQLTYTPKWKIELMKKRESKDAKDESLKANEHEASTISNNVDRPVRVDELMTERFETTEKTPSPRKSSISVRDRANAFSPPNEPPNNNELVTERFGPTEKMRWPRKPSVSVRDRANAFSPRNESPNNELSPWVVKALRKNSGIQKPDVSRSESDANSHTSPPAESESNLAGTEEIYVMKSAPPRLSARDRSLALSGETNESSRVSRTSLRSKRSFSDTIDGSPPRTGHEVSKSHLSGEVDGSESPRKTMKTSSSARNARRSRAANLLGALSAQVDPSETSNPSLDESKVDENRNARKSLVLAAHLAATADDISPQDRYRMRFKNAEDTTATDGSQEISDVQSLKSFFEGSRGTAPSDEDDDSDDRTVESLRSKFESIAESKEEPSAVSRMRAKFEKPKTSFGRSRRGFRGNDSISGAFTKFEQDPPRWTPHTKPSTAKMSNPRTLISSEDDRSRSSYTREGVTTSAPSKLQSTRAVGRSPPKPEDTARRRQSYNTEVERGMSSLSQGMSVAERIRALKLKESPRTPIKPVVSDEAGDTTTRPTTGTALASDTTESPTIVVSHSNLHQQKTVRGQVSAASRKDTSAGDPQVGIHSKEPPSPEVPVEKTQMQPMRSYPSVRDRVNAFSARPEQSRKADNASRSNLAVERAKSLAYGRKSWSQNQGHLRKKSSDKRNVDRHTIDRRDMEENQEQQVFSIPSDEKIESGMPVSSERPNTEGSVVGSDGTNGSDSEYDDGVTLDLSIADVSQLTNPTCLQSKDDGAVESSSEGDGSSEHTSDVAKGTNTEGKGPSEASSSQASEAAAPLIARMKFSDDASTSVNSNKGGFPGRSKAGQNHSSRWEPLTPVVDESEVARQSPDGTHESAWSQDEIDATFPVESQDGAVSATGEKLWQPFQAENWDASSPSFGTNWSPPSNVEPFETTVSEATSFGRLSENTPVRRNTSRRASPPFGNEAARPSRNVAATLPEVTKRSTVPTSPFSRTRPTIAASNQESPVTTLRPTATQVDRQTVDVTARTSPTITQAAPRSSSTKETLFISRESASPSPPTTAIGISKHALLMSKLRSLKEARMRRSVATGFHRSNVVYPSERPPTAPRESLSPTSSSALAPFLRPGFRPSKPSVVAATQEPQQQHYCVDRVVASAPESSPLASVDDEQSASTRSSTQFGGNKFVESLELD